MISVKRKVAVRRIEQIIWTNPKVTNLFPLIRKKFKDDKFKSGEMNATFRA